MKKLITRENFVSCNSNFLYRNKFGSKIGMIDYINHVIKHTRCSFETIGYTLCLLQRLKEMNPNVITESTINLLFLVTLSVSQKIHETRPDYVIEYSRIGLLNLKDYSNLEIEFLEELNWKVFVNNKEIESTVKILYQCGNDNDNDKRMN